MKKLLIICLGLTTFLTCAGVAYAAFNYDSANNYFLMDSILKTGGHYILVGDALSGYCENSNLISQSQCQAGGSVWHEVLSKRDALGNTTESTDFFAVSNNLIFSEGAKFISGATRQIVKNADGVYEFKTNALSISGNNNLDISTLEVNDNLEISPVGSSLSITMNQNLDIKSALSFFDITNPDPYHIYVDKVITPAIGVLSGTNRLRVNTGTLILSSGTTGIESTATSIKFGEVPLCTLVKNNNLISEKDAKPVGTWVTRTASNMIAATNCPIGYYIYDDKIAINYTKGFFVCCKIDDFENR